MQSRHLAIGCLIVLAAGPLARALGSPGGAVGAFRAAALALPFVALCQVYLGGTRGLKIMRHTLYIFWAGQPVAWIVLMAGGWLVSKSTGASVLAYACARLRQNRIRIIAGDKVTLEISPYDLTRGRINFRHKDERPVATAPRRFPFKRK